MKVQQKQSFRNDFPYLCLMAIAFSFLGWSIENIARVISYGLYDSRFHILPFIPVYGLIPFAAYFLSDPNSLTIFGHKFFKSDSKKTRIISNILYLLICMALVFLGELVVGNTYEFLFGARLWNYENQLLHFTPYTSLMSTLGFGVGAYVIIKFICHPFIDGLRNNMERKNALIYVVIYSILLCDMFVMMIRTALNGVGPVYWQLNLNTFSNPAFMKILVVLFQLSAVFFMFFNIYNCAFRKVKYTSLQNRSF